MLQYLFRKQITYSQYLQDLFVEIVFFSNTKSGYFIDIGAYDGVKFSNSLFFEKYKNWKGIAVEPNEKVFNQLKQNRNCTLLKCVITDTDGQVEYLRIDGDGEMLSGIIKNFDEKHKVRITNNTATFGGTTFMETVQSFSINTIISNHTINKIDLLSIDTEGSEMQILRNFPFDKLYPRIILVENNYRTDEFKTFLATKGYHYCFRLGDDIFCRDKITYALKFRIWFFRLIKKMKWYKIGY